jgi:hypothetical protein
MHERRTPVAPHWPAKAARLQPERCALKARTRHPPGAAIIAVIACLSSPALALLAARGQASQSGAVDAVAASHLTSPEATSVAAANDYTLTRRENDMAAMQAFRPGYAFWQNIFTIPDGSIAYGSAVDGRLLAVFPAKGDWSRLGVWTDPAMAEILQGRPLPSALEKRRDEVARLLEQVAGPVVHNPTRGQFLAPSAKRYGGFLEEWGTIYERFAVPADIGLAQAMVESGLSGTRRSKAGAVGFCQWLMRNWRALDRLTPHPIEATNQTTQAPYCAAYLTILATRHGSFIPALSEHHSGGTNVGRTLINGERLGGADIRERYFMGAQFAHELRTIALSQYRDLYRTYGPRSYRYAEMTFGNTFNVASITGSTPQVKIHAMRAPRAIALSEITQRTRLSVDEVKRFNPALVKRVPTGATLYLPVYVKEFGQDVAFWHRPPSAAYVAVLNDFIRLDAVAERWEDPSFEPVLREFQRRFQATKTEEGSVMATVLAYAIQEMYSSGRGAILRDFRTNDQIRELFERGVQEREVVRAATIGQDW